MGLWESALILLGVGIVSSRFKAGVGLGELGTGIQTLIAAPLTGTGTGLSSFAGGVRDLSETLGDLGRGIGELFKNIPSLPSPLLTPPLLPGAAPSNGVPLITVSGGDKTSDLAGGGGNVPPPPPYIPPTQPTTPTYTWRSTSMYNRDRPVMM